MLQKRSVSVSVFVHAAGICESKNVGAGTRIWAFAHVLPGAHIGRECNICDNVFIENDVVIGVSLRSGPPCRVSVDDDNCPYGQR